jgi:multiple sugar transport system permease protein
LIFNIEPFKTNALSSKKRNKRIADFVSLFLVFICAVGTLLPIWWMFKSSLMDNISIFEFPPGFLPDEWRFSNYIETLKVFPFWTYLKNTMTIIIPSVIGGTTTATLAGYAFARLRFRGKNFLFSMCVGSMLLPYIVTLIPLYIAWTRFLGLGNTFWPLIIPHFCGGGAFNIFLIRQFIMTIPKELDEAAMIDGAGRMRILGTIIMPAIRPAMIVVGLLLFIMLWNDVLGPVVYINSMEKYTFAVALNIFRGSFGTNWVKLMAATCMSITPGIIIYLIGQKYFIEGVVMTGLKN